MSTTILLVDAYAYTGMLSRFALTRQVISADPQTYLFTLGFAQYDLRPDNMAIAVANLNIALQALPWPLKVISVAEGTRIVYKWMRDCSEYSLVDPSQVEFWCLAPPENAVNGIVTLRPDLYTPYNGASGLPERMPYTLHNVIRQYDGWCDYPNAANPTTVALRNATVGMTWAHTNYFSVLPDDPTNLYYADGRVDYYFNPTPVMPLVATTHPMDGITLQLREDAMIRDGLVEPSYDRVYGPVPTLPYPLPAGSTNLLPGTGSPISQ